MAVAAGTGPRARAAAPAEGHRVPDGLAAEQLWALAREERLAAARRAEAEASRAAEAARPSVVWPAPGAITGWYGERRGRSAHPGTDIDGETGDPVVAAAAGTVAWAGSAPAGYSGYGIVVIVDHGDGVQTLYAHLSAVAVAVGQPVRAGDRIGSIGSTGHSTGSHLHFEVRRGGTIGNPAEFLPPR
ncbi:MAG TPA: M23 family metallopeptidase [Acidimicrobiales bacterium]|nr:M23 family metallopeptidase [Acidimicrobiales bacterium]